jgi:hypothetical protein
VEVGVPQAEKLLPRVPRKPQATVVDVDEPPVRRRDGGRRALLEEEPDLLRLSADVGRSFPIASANGPGCCQPSMVAREYALFRLLKFRVPTTRSPANRDHETRPHPFPRQSSFSANGFARPCRRRSGRSA